MPDGFAERSAATETGCRQLLRERREASSLLKLRGSLVVTSFQKGSARIEIKTEGGPVFMLDAPTLELVK